MTNNLSDIQFSPRYDTDENNIVSEFYNIGLSHSCIYKRAVGYFSSGSLILAAQGIFGLIKNKGKMFLIIGAPLSEEEYEAISDSSRKKYFEDKCISTLDDIYDNSTSKKTRVNIELLSYMVFNDILEIRFALKKIGMYHDKIGVFVDSYGRRVTFQGSANETLNALGDGINSESIMVFSDEDKDTFSKWGEKIERKFDSLWDDNVKNIKVVKMSEIFLTDIKKYGCDKTENYFNAVYSELSGELDSDKEIITTPQVPVIMNGKDYKLKKHQQEAIINWQKNKFLGIFHMATGSGKTITSLHAATKLFEKKESNLFLIIAVPYQSLAEQWKIEMLKFNMKPIICAYAKSTWRFELKKTISKFNLLPEKQFYSIIVVNATLKTSDFQEAIQSISHQNLMIISDECHHHASTSFDGFIPQAKFKMGLSATPWEIDDSDYANNLKIKYGEIVAQYSLKDALDDQILCPYHYYIIKCEMDEDELETYLSISKNISILENNKKLGKFIEENVLMHLYLKRTRMLGGIKSKTEKLEMLIKNHEILKKSLFYCGEGNDYFDEDDNSSTPIIDKVANIISKRGYKIAKFTSLESASQREDLLQSFKNGIIDSLIAKRVLDEGIDVPDCKYAFILASSNSMRQYIQRRGRILRKSANKDYATIYDFVVVPQDENYFNNSLMNLKEREDARITEFSALANYFEVINVQ